MFEKFEKYFYSGRVFPNIEICINILTGVLSKKKVPNLNFTEQITHKCESTL